MLDNTTYTSFSASSSLPANMLPPIASIWRRLGAFIVDAMLLGLAGFALGLAASSALYELGPYGRFIGWPVLIVYFGVAHCARGNGQTLGKRVFRIAVRDREGKPLPFSRSLARALVLSSIYIMNGWQLPIIQSNPILNWIAAFVILGLGGAFVYTMIFNRRTRQGIHDLIAGSYVVRLSGTPISVPYPVIARLRLIIAGIIVSIAALLALGAALASPTSVLGVNLDAEQQLHQVLSQDTRFFGVGVVYNTAFSSQARPIRSLTIEAWYKGSISGTPKDEVIYSIARTALSNYKRLDQIEAMTIRVTSAYDLGIATWSYSQVQSASMNAWQAMTR